MKKTTKKVAYNNKKANFSYHIEEKIVSGISLLGWEAASLNNHTGNIDIGYCIFDKDNRLCVKNISITPMHNHVVQNKTVTELETRDRYLLCTKHQLKKIADHIGMKGNTCIPLKLYRDDNWKWKLEIGLVSGKNNYDKRQTLKDRDIKKDMDKTIKNFYK